MSDGWWINDSSERFPYSDKITTINTKFVIIKLSHNQYLKWATLNYIPENTRIFG